MTALELYIYLQWIGDDKVEEGMLDRVKDHIERTFAVLAKIREVDGRPPDAFDPSRGQYSSTKILRWILEDVPSDARKIVAVTDCDLYIPVLTFVFGEAQLGGKGAVVSTARLRLDLNGHPTPKHLYRARLMKECVHELGHTFGLIHCRLSRCVMSRSNTILDVDRKSGDLCRECQSLLRRLQAKG
jgi:archaemetzincin